MNVKIRPYSDFSQPLLNKLIEKATEYQQKLAENNIRIFVYVWIKNNGTLYPKIEFSDTSTNEELQFDMSVGEKGLSVKEVFFKRFEYRCGKKTRINIPYSEASETLQKVYDLIY